MQIGRILGLTEPHDWDATNDSAVAMTADYQSTAASDGLFVRDQLLAYPTPDELAIPVILTSEPRSTGFYRPARTQILTDALSRIRGHIFNYQMDLERVASFTNPWIESILNGARLTNAIGAVDADTQWFHAVPSARPEYTHSAVPANVATRVGADGNLSVVYDTGVAGIPALARWSIPPANYYIGAARIEQGTALLPVVGRAMLQADVTNWRLENGLVRVTGSVDTFSVSVFNGSTWSAATNFAMSIAGVGFSVGAASIVVLRNSPEESIVRLSVNGTGSLAREIGVTDLALRRGDRMVRGYFSSSLAATWRIGLGAFGPAATAIAFGAWTGGAIRQTANDASGNRPVIVSMQQATTSDLVHSNLTLNANSKTLDFGIGLEIGGSGSVAPDDAVSLARQYLAAQSEEQRIVAR